MSTEQAREEFERWLISTGESADSQNGIYLSPIANISWEAWQESRKLILIHLPKAVLTREFTDDVPEYRMMAFDVKLALRAAGITVKEQKWIMPRNC